MAAGSIDPFLSRVRVVFPPDANLILARSGMRVAGPEELIVVGRPDRDGLRWIEGLLHSNDARRLWPILSEQGYRLTWGDSDGELATRSTPHSWSVLWTLGSHPLRVWSRGVWLRRPTLVLTVDDGHLQCAALGKVPLPNVQGARARSRWWGVKEVSVTTDRGAARVHSCLRMDPGLEAWGENLPSWALRLASRIDEAVRAKSTGVVGS